MPDPALKAALAMDSALHANGVRTGAEGTTLRHLKKENMPLPIAHAKVIHTTYSPRLQEIVARTNTYSVNLFAEHLLLHAGLALGSVPETEAAADSVLAFWNRRGMDTEGLSMHDGSGLTKYNAISPIQLVWLLGYMKRESQYSEEYVSSMAVAGKSGTLEPLCKGTVAEGRLRAKSGTINRAKAYAGYVTSISGREIAFSMVVNGFSGSSLEARDKLEKLMVALAELKK
jgi:D-alanyl-D-alanine carboxypeptidase/D-alanyl-D-alanine-endopeptidase (penicillin-binding protein 4)